MTHKKMKIANNYYDFIKIKKNEDHIKILYRLLKKRTNSISHESLPSYMEHKLFVFNNPYRAWYLIKEDKKIIGSLYLLKNNTLGINILEPDTKKFIEIIRWIIQKFRPLPKIASLRPANFYINVSPSNKKLKSALLKIIAEPIQISYLISEKTINFLMK